MGTSGKCVAADGTLLDLNVAGLAMVEADGPEQISGRSVYSRRGQRVHGDLPPAGRLRGQACDPPSAPLRRCHTCRTPDVSCTVRSLLYTGPGGGRCPPVACCRKGGTSLPSPLAPQIT
jgi:hypothetical protein